MGDDLSFSLTSKGKRIIWISIVALILILSFVMAQSFKSLQPSVEIATSSQYLKVFLFDYAYGGYIYTYTDDLDTLNFGKTPPGSKIGYTLVIVNLSNVTLYDITWNSSVNEVTQYITDDMIISTSVEYEGLSGDRYRFRDLNVVPTWPVTLPPKRGILVHYCINIANNCPLNVTYIWSVSFNSAST